MTARKPLILRSRLGRRLEGLLAECRLAIPDELDRAPQILGGIFAALFLAGLLLGLGR
jgi:hypothetical protein